MCLALCVQVLVLLPTSSVSAGGSGPARQPNTPTGQRAAGRLTGQPDRPQQHRQQLQPERQSHMRLRTPMSLQQQKH